MKRVIEIIVIVLAMALVGGLVRGYMKSKYQHAPSPSTDVTKLTNKEPSTRALLDRITKELNVGLPQMIDSQTRMDSTEVLSNNSYAYNYTIVSGADSITQEQVERYSVGVERDICSTPEMRKIFDLGVTAVYRYRDNNGYMIASIPINTKTCSDLANQRYSTVEMDAADRAERINQIPRSNEYSDPVAAAEAAADAAAAAADAAASAEAAADAAANAR